MPSLRCQQRKGGKTVSRQDCQSQSHQVGGPLLAAEEVPARRQPVEEGVEKGVVAVREQQRHQGKEAEEEQHATRRSWRLAISC